MSYCNICENEESACTCESQQPFCDQCSEDNSCAQIMNADCVVYHPEPDTRPSKLDGLGIGNNASLSDILEAVDDMLGSGSNTPIVSVPSPTVVITSNGVSGHTIKADVKLSANSGNIIEEKEDGLYAKAANDEYKVKLDDGSTPKYLEGQFVGDSDGIVSISVVKEAGQLKFKPSIDMTKLLEKIRASYGDEFCNLVSECTSYIWAMNTYACRSSDLDLVVQKTINSLPEPTYSFEDGGRLYFVSASNNTGKIWSLNPATATTVSDIVYLNETRTGTPYGASGGAYTSGSPYRANADTTGTSFINGRPFYDSATRTLYIHSNKSFGCDYYNFVTATWDKISVGSTGSVYNSTSSNDFFTHTALESHKDTNLLIAGWGSDASNRGSKVIIIDKTTKTITSEVDTSVSSTFAGITGNPFNLNWGALLSSDGRIFVGKANVSAYKHLAVFNSSLVPTVEINLANSSVGFDGGVTNYWQNMFMDRENNRIYVNDYMSRTIDVFDTTTYALLKTFHLDNNRGYVAAEAILNINSVTGELFCDVTYGGTSSSTSDNAPTIEMVSYKINRTTLDIEKVYIGDPKATSLTVLTTGQIVSTTVGAVNPSSPTSVGQAIFSEKNTDSLKNGTLDVLTLKEINSSTGAATGNTKTNLSADPDYIAPYFDSDLCPVDYTLNPPSNVILTAKGARYALEFGLNDDVVMNPALAYVKATIKNLSTSSTVTTKTWTIPNIPNRNAFIDNQAVTITVGSNISVDLEYLNSSSAPIATFTNIKSFTSIA